MAGGGLSAKEWRRKAVHAGMGLCALLLRWLDWRMAAALALAALLFNLLVMPRIGRGIYRDPSKPMDSGIVAYPAMVLVLILLFRHQLGYAAALWGVMAFGDPAATVAGRRFGHSLPWNAKKTWSGLLAYVLVGTLAATALWLWTVAGYPGQTERSSELVFLVDFLIFMPVVVLGGFLESLDTGLDDNWIPALPCALMMFSVESGTFPLGLIGLQPAVGWGMAALVNVGVAAAMLSGRVVSTSGAIAGALLGFVILAFGGWPAYAILWTFFLLATVATKLGYRRKEMAGTAQQAKGRRDARHAVANCGVGAVIALVAARSFGPGHEIGSIPLFALAGAFAAALADTLGTELGSLYGRNPVSLWRRERVSPGTPGAVSMAGLAGGLLGGGAIGIVAWAIGLIPGWGAWIVAIAGVAGSVAESLLADGVQRSGRRVEHDFANAFNTFVGASVAAEIAASIAAGRLYLPFES